MHSGMLKKTLFYLPAALSGVAMVLIFPRSGLDYLAWVCMVPLIVAMLCQPQRSAALQGVVAGTLYHLGLVYWVVVSMQTYGGVPRPLAAVLLTVLSLFLSVFVALPLWCSAFIRKRTGIRLTLTLPLCWVASEYIKSWILTGFPWELLGYSQFQNLRIIQIADITGVYGVSFVLLSVNCALAAIVYALITRRRIAVLEPCCGLLLVAACLLYGHTRLQEFRDPAGPRLNTLLVQPNIPQDLKWDPAYLDATMQRLFLLSTAQAPGRNGSHHLARIGNTVFLSRRAGLPCAGCPHTPAQQRLAAVRQSIIYTVRQAALFITTARFSCGLTDQWPADMTKCTWYPGENTYPCSACFRSSIDWLAASATSVQAPASGCCRQKTQRSQRLSVTKLSSPISRAQFVRLGAHCIVNITNDAWFGQTCAPYQHLSMAVLRAVENKRFLVRAANTGISAAIAPTGEIVAQTKLFTETALPATIIALDQLTLYCRMGDVFAGLCLLATAALLLVARRSRPRPIAP